VPELGVRNTSVVKSVSKARMCRRKDKVSGVIATKDRGGDPG